MAFNYSPKIVTDGLVMYVDAANPNSYLSGSTTWNDISRNSNNGTLVNGPIFNSSNGGNIVFDGVDDFTSFNNSLSGSTTSNFTMGAVVKATAIDPTNGTIFVSRGRDGFGNGWSMNISFGTTGRPQCGVVTTSPSLATYYAIGDNNLNAGTWYYITGVWNAGVAVSVYINGILQKSTSTTSTNLRTSTTGFVLGTITTSAYYDFSMANCHIYNRALNVTEILQNYNATKSRFNL